MPARRFATAERRGDTCTLPRHSRHSRHRQLQEQILPRVMVAAMARDDGDLSDGDERDGRPRCSSHTVLLSRSHLVRVAGQWPLQISPLGFLHQVCPGRAARAARQRTTATWAKPGEPRRRSTLFFWGHRCRLSGDGRVRRPTVIRIRVGPLGPAAAAAAPNAPRRHLCPLASWTCCATAQGSERRAAPCRGRRRRPAVPPHSQPCVIAAVQRLTD